MKFFQARADITGVIGTDATLFRPNVNEKIMDGRVPGNAIFPCELAGHVVSRHRQQLSLARIDIVRSERDERVPQTSDGFLVLGADHARAESKCEDRDRSEIHVDNIY